MEVTLYKIFIIFKFIFLIIYFVELNKYNLEKFITKIKENTRMTKVRMQRNICLIK